MVQALSRFFSKISYEKCSSLSSKCETLKNEASFLGGFCKEVSVFEHVLDFYIDAVGGAARNE